MTTNQGFTITKPESILKKDIKANFKGLFTNLAKATISGVTLKWDDMTKGLVDAVGALGLEDSFEERAWLLVFNALTQALATMVNEHQTSFLIGPDHKDYEAIADEIAATLEYEEISSTEELFLHPQNLPLLKKVQQKCKEWLIQTFNQNEAQAEAMINRLPAYFVFALNDQWRRHPSLFSTLQSVDTTPFKRASDKEQRWLYYYAWLQKQVTEPVFEESFCLEQIYIPLRAYYETKEHALNGEVSKIVRTVIDLRSTIIEWLESNNSDDPIRMISGGPGSGKSSFAKILAAHYAKTYQKPILFIPLHLFQIDSDLTEALDTYIRGDSYLNHNPLDREQNDEKLLIIFDGLDELAMQGHVGEQSARNFVDEVIRKVEQLNHQSETPRVQVIITGRVVAVQANETKFRKTKQVLHVLPYLVDVEKVDRENPERVHRDSRWEDPLELTVEDQRNNWWKRFGELTGRNYDSIPPELDSETITPITMQPLLNYLVALSYTRDKIDFSTNPNLNEIYFDLLQGVFERKSDNERVHSTVKDLDETAFYRILEEIALAAWHGEGRTTSVAEVKCRCNKQTLCTIESFAESAQSGISQLFLAFYFKKAGNRQGGDETFEFTHKSFGEYLTARRIVRGVNTIHEALNNPDFGIDDEEALLRWVKLCGPTRLDSDLMRFIRNEVALYPDKASNWQKTLIRLINYLLRYSMPMEQAKLKDFKEMNQQAIHAEEALLAVLSHSAKVSKAISDIDWPAEISFGEWIRRLQGQRIGGKNMPILHSLPWLNIAEQRCDVLDLYGANINNTQMASTTLIFTTLEFANLSKVVLKGSALLRSNFRHAFLEDADLEEADLEEADLEGADLDGANLKKANLKKANLKKARLRRANLQKANLQGVSYKDCQISSTTDFRGAKNIPAGLKRKIDEAGAKR